MPYEHTRNQHKLKKLIYEKGYTITKLCEISGVSNWTINAIFRGTFKKTRKSTIELIAKALGVSYEEVEVMCNG